ncbi:glucose dehydrogenase [FAD, quinone]-like [Diorhabda sublineata]|uniref:glucose dehydrogenase [FAD, quinone]-like n=1 Tax=Diorhabda sublineata TaxID=1163346 RepID=UPI0024E143FA|nr:glucose dehydrogenase [FAD, quinone]-like [Diorhabda sublineata]
MMDVGASMVDTCPGNLQGLSSYLFITLINSLFGSKCKLGARELYNDDYAPKLRDGDEFDFIVIGSGSAGSVVSNKLSENKNWKVLVLEAGGYPSALSDIPGLMFFLHGTDEDWQYKTEPTTKSCLGFKNGQCSWPRGKVFGGTSVFNAMLYIKGYKKDYDQWAQLGNTGWDWETVRHYFKKIENVQDPNASDQYGRNGYMMLSKISIVLGEMLVKAMREAFENMGYSSLQEEEPAYPMGTLEAYQCNKDGVRYNAAKAFLGKVKERPNLFTSLHSFVNKILIDPSTKTATGVEVKIGGKILKLKAKKEVILSAGSINSPQILMLSGIGPKEHLESLNIKVLKDAPVGYNLEDHMINIGTLVTFSPECCKAETFQDQLYQYFMYQKGFLATSGIMNFWNFFNTRNDSHYPNIQNHYFFYPLNHQHYLEQFLKSAGVKPEIVADSMEYIKRRPSVIVGNTLMNPKSKGRLTLKSSNPEDKPLIESGYFTDAEDDDLQVLLESIRFVEKMMQTPPLNKFDPQILRLNLPDCDKYEYRSDDYWKCSLRHLTTTLYHPTGTCKMGPVGDKTAVVDPKLKVHGIKNLRVADASIMPIIVSANTHAPSMMIGHKAGVMITEQWSNQKTEL